MAFLSRPAGATVPADLCTGNPCNVTTAMTVDAGSVLDFGAGTTLRLKSTAALTIGPGGGARVLLLRAGTIILEAGARILGNGDGAAVTLDAVAGPIELQASGSTLSRILVNGVSAGSIDLQATGNVTVAGTLDASASGDDGLGGSVTIVSGGTVNITRQVDIGGAGAFTSAGELSVTAQSGITLDAIVDAAASGDGGTVDLFTATGDVLTTKKIDISGGSPEGLGGSIDLMAAAGHVNVNGTVVGNGGTGIEESCGDGGELNLTAGQAVSLANTVTLNSGTQCFGGAISVVAGTTFTQQIGADVVAQGPGSFGGGGSLTVQTGGSVTLRNFNLTSPGVGGFIDIRSSSGTVSLLSAVDARGTGTFGIGGVSDITGCDINIAATGKIDTRGNFAIPNTGTNALHAGGALTIAGQLLAQTANKLEVRAGAPTITGAVTPAPMIVVNPMLPDCAQLAVCGDGTVDDGEICDDDNIADCDGCQGDCQRVDDVCGDDIVECGEQCDDGNNDDGDGCNADCTLPGAAGVRFAGSVLGTAGCLAQWEVKLEDPVINPVSGFPKVDQDCVDGDPGCDQDGQNDYGCSFATRICLRVPDPRIPTCSAGPIEYMTVKNPDSFTIGPQVDRDNAQAIATALQSLGGAVRMAGDVLQSGPALSANDNCTPTFNLRVPRSIEGKKSFNILAHDTNNVTMSANQLRLHCLQSTAACGNGVLEAGEICDDGDNDSCDGCSSSCIPESCGDGIVQCGEQCDEGPENGTPGSRCSSTCRELPPELRIPGGGSKTLDCGIEFSAELNPGSILADAKGIPKTLQTCVDNDPTCDRDPTVGTCRVRVWTCAGGADTRLGCVAASLNTPEVLAPTTKATGTALAARQALLQALQGLPSPVGPGEVCTAPFEVDVAAGPKGLTLKPKMRFVGSNKSDIDTLKLRCLVP